MLRDYVVAGIGDPAGVLVIDETGFLKKGRMSAGVQRQYTGTAGRVENCQVGVFLAYANPGGARAFLDRELYVPESWCTDRDRCRQAGIPDETEFATKPELGRRMLQRALAGGIPFSWFAADEVYGQNPGLRSWLEGEGISYVMAVPCSETFTTAAGQMRVIMLLGGAAQDGWRRVLRRFPDVVSKHEVKIINTYSPGPQAFRHPDPAVRGERRKALSNAFDQAAAEIKN